jgi:Immunoglobulin domain
VYSPPVIYQNLSNYVSITCVVEGYPVPNITWVFLEKNGTVNSVNGNIRENVYTTNITLYLTLFNIQSNQNGTYICYMLNNLLTQIQVDVVVAIRPEAPVILDAKAYQSRSYLSWYVPIDNPTNSELTELLLEWSLDFYDINTEPYSKRKKPRVTVPFAVTLFKFQTLVTLTSRTEMSSFI